VRERRFWPTARISCAFPIFDRPSMRSFAASRRSSMTVIAPAPPASPLRRSPLACRSLGSFATKRTSCRARKLRDCLLLTRAPLGFLYVLARRPALLLRSHLASILSIKGRMPRPAGANHYPSVAGTHLFSFKQSVYEAAAYPAPRPYDSPPAHGGRNWRVRSLPLARRPGYTLRAAERCSNIARRTR
jgi:hypothetical protein